MEDYSYWYNLVTSNWIVGSFFVLFLYVVHWYQRPHKFPPGPRGLPFLGYLPFLSERSECDVYKLSEKYGPVMSVRMGPSETVFLNDYDSINKAFVKRGTVLSGRSRFASFEAVKKGHGIGVVDYSDFWKVQRRFGIATLRGFGVGKKGMENLCLDELDHFIEEIRKKKGEAFNISTSIHKAVCNNICSITLGKRFDYDDKQFMRMLDIIINGFGDPLVNITERIIMMVPTIKHVPPFSYFYKKFKNMLGELFGEPLTNTP